MLVFAVMTVVALLNVVTRYFVRYSLAFTEELVVSLFVWLTLAGERSAEDLLPAAVEEGVAYVAGRSFFVDDSGPGTMRLTFAKESPENIEEGVKRLSRAARH